MLLIDKFMFVFTLQIAMATVILEILSLFVKHHFLIVFVAILNQITKKLYIVVKKLRDYSVVFILTTLVAVYLLKSSMLFFLRGGSWAGQRPMERQKRPKTMFSKN